MRNRERGAASVWVVNCLSLLLVVGAGTGVVAAMVVAQRRAQSAADLAALAGAHAWVSGRDACAAAGRFASANGARLVVCVVSDAAVTVEVLVSGPHWLGQRADFTGEARAGPR